MENAPAVPSANARVVQIEMRQAAVAVQNLSMLKNVSDAPNRVDQRDRRIVVHFAAQAINMYIHDVRCGIDSHSPHVVQNHSSRNDPPGISAKIFQKGKLLWGQL